MIFTCRAVELDFLDSAAWRFENAVELDARSGAVLIRTSSLGRATDAQLGVRLEVRAVPYGARNGRVRMQALTWVFVVFALLELMNVVVLYGAPGSRKANGVGVFTAWEKSKADPEVHLLVRYLVYWVAGVKVIFLALLAVIVLTGTDRTKTAAGAALAASIALFFWRLFPLARRADASGALLPAGYSRTLGIMIALMVAAVALATISSV